MKKLLLMAMLAFSTQALSDEKQSTFLKPEEIIRYQNLAEKIKNHHVDKIDDKKLFDSCLQGMASGSDPHSAYDPPTHYTQEEFKSMYNSNNKYGVGLELSTKNNKIIVISTIEGSPAEKAGILPGDIITRVDNYLAGGLSLDEVIKRLRGGKGSPLKLSISRDPAKDQMIFDLVREKVVYNPVTYKLHNTNYAVIRIRSFQRDTLGKVVGAVQSLIKDTPDLRGIVVDLRNNPGGLMTSANDVASVFIQRTDSIVVYTKGRTRNMNQVYRTDKKTLSGLPNKLSEIPLVVLVNGQSAAGSEIVAGALQDYKRATLIGSPTFGKDTIQTLLRNEDGSDLKVTSDRWYTPAGRSVFPDGLQPDIKADPSNEKEMLSVAMDIIEKKHRINTLRRDALSAIGDIDKEFRLWKKLLELKPDDHQAIRLLGVIHATQNQENKAEDYFRKAVEQNPKSGLTWNALCWGHILLGKWEKADRECAKSLEMEADNLSSTVNRGHTHLLRGNIAEAMGWYKKAVPLIKSRDELDEALSDFDLFITKEWKAELVIKAKDWFSIEGKKQLESARQ